MKKIPFNQLTDEQKELAQAAFTAMKTAYNPYSHFYVGASLKSASNQIITGSNVENAAYGSCICAERSAIVKANSEGHQHFSQMAIIGGTMDKDNAIIGSEIVSPCGACRQMIFESSQISNIDIELILLNGDLTEAIVTTISELLPLGFGPKNMGL